MVCPVVLLWEDEMRLLQELHHWVQVGVRVRPLVDLIGEGDEESHGKEKPVQGIVVFDVAWRVDQEVVAPDCKEGQGEEAVVTICFNIVMPSDGQRINVMLSEGTNECLDRDREIMDIMQTYLE